MLKPDIKILRLTGKKEEVLVSCNQRVYMMSLEVMEAKKKADEATKNLKKLAEE